MKHTECTGDNRKYTSRFDTAAKAVKDALGSYDKISHLIFVATDNPVSGVSVRRWLVNRTLPLPIACTLVDLMDEHAPGNEVVLADFFPYLEEYVI